MRTVVFPVLLSVVEKMYEGLFVCGFGAVCFSNAKASDAILRASSLFSSTLHPVAFFNQIEYVVLWHQIPEWRKPNASGLVDV